MKYDIRFDSTPIDDSWGSEILDVWKKESVIPRVGDSVFLKNKKKNGSHWMTVKSVGFSLIQGKRRLVIIDVI